MPHLFSATVVDGKVTIVATVAGDQLDTPQPTVIRGTDSTADETPTLFIIDGEGGLDWSTPVEDGIDGTNGVRGAGQFPASVVLGAGVEPPLVTSTTFSDNALVIIVARLGAGATPVAGDVAIITYVRTDSTVQTRSGIFNGTSWEEFDYQIDGNLLVTGTVVADTINANTVIANDVQSSGFQAGVSGYQLDGSTGNAEFSNVTIRGNSTVESTSIEGTGIFGVAEEGLSIMTAQSFADGQHSTNMLDQIGDASILYPASNYGTGWSIDNGTDSQGNPDVILSIGVSSTGASIPVNFPGAELPAGVTGGFIVRLTRGSSISYFRSWTGTGLGNPNTSTTISNNTRLAGDALVAGVTTSVTLAFFNGIEDPVVGDTFTSYINRQDGQFNINPDLLFQFEREAVTSGSAGAMTISDLVLTLEFAPVHPDSPLISPVTTPSLTITETAPTTGETVGTRVLSITDSSIVQFGPDQSIAFQPAAFGTLPTVEIGDVVTLRVSFTVENVGTGNFRGLSTLFNVRDISLATGRPSLFSTLALDTSDTTASIGSSDPNQFNLTVAGGLGTRVLYDRVFDGTSQLIRGIDLGKAGFVMVRWDNTSPNADTPNVGIYPFQNAFFTNAADRLQSSTTNANSTYYVERFVPAPGESLNDGQSAIKLVDVIDNAGSRKGSLWTKVTESGLNTELMLTPESGATGVFIIGVFITSWNFGTIIPVSDIENS